MLPISFGELHRILRLNPDLLIAISRGSGKSPPGVVVRPSKTYIMNLYTRTQTSFTVNFASGGDK